VLFNGRELKAVSRSSGGTARLNTKVVKIIRVRGRVKKSAVAITIGRSAFPALRVIVDFATHH
jgi:hypothetical protein